MPVVFEFDFSNGFYLLYFLNMYSSFICLRTSHDLPNQGDEIIKLKFVCIQAENNATAKLHRALPGPVGRPVLP